ncbi:MAG: PKD domain-containing protein [Bacteroidetes bacterium]|nr:PKD domain-containing protein [Bacteroidota bacterium]
MTIDGNFNAFNGTSYNWSLSPGNIGTVQTPNAVQTIIDINSAGTFTISATANGCCTAPQSICNWDTTLTLVQGPSLASSAIPAICNSGTINPANYFTIGGSVSTYSWDFSGGNPNTSSSANPGAINYNSPGNYVVSLVVTGSCGIDSISENFIVGAPPILNVQSSNLFGCDTLTIDFINTSPPNQNYNWTANGGIFTNGTSSMSEAIPSTSDSGYAWNIFFNSTNYFSYSELIRLLFYSRYRNLYCKCFSVECLRFDNTYRHI